MGEAVRLMSLMDEGVKIMVKGIIEIFTEACKGCLYCVAACPRGVLGVGSATNTKGYQYVTPVALPACVGCGLCARMCPEAAISVYREADKNE